MSITTQAMVLNLQISAWTGHRLDKAATAKVTADAGADSDAARVNKHLVPKKALKDIESAKNAIRTHFYERTLPWKDNGDRLITRAMYLDFASAHAALVREYDRAVDNFLENEYPAAIDQASFRMGDMFDPADYPSSAALRHKFYVNLDIDAVTEAGDFRVEMEQSQVDEIRSSMERAMQDRLGRAMLDVWERLQKVVTHFHERMADEDAIFRNSTITNLRDLVAILPGLNVLNDPQITQIGREIEQTIAGYDPVDLRKDKEARFEAANEAKQIIDRMGAYMSAFNAPEQEAA